MIIHIEIEVNRPLGQAIGIKEQVAMALEGIGDVRVVSVTEERLDQITIGVDWSNGADWSPKK